MVRRRKDCRERRGFTLVELLVVVGIVALLIAILFPVLSKVRKHAQEVHCAANLRSIGHAMTMYTQQYGYYPGGWRGSVAVWPPRLRAFLNGESGVFLCPAQDERCEWKMGGPAPGGLATRAETRWGYVEGEPLLSRYGTFFSYGYNVWGSLYSGKVDLGLGDHVGGDPLVPGLHIEIRANRVKKPAEMIAIADSTVDGAWDCGIHLENSGFDLLPAPPVPGPIHRGGANVLFCDGHVQWYLQKEITLPAESIEAERAIKRMWNNNNQAH